MNKKAYLIGKILIGSIFQVYFKLETLSIRFLCIAVSFEL